MNIIRNHQKTILTLLLSLFIWSCSQIPITGRRQFKLLPETTLMGMSAEAYNQIKDTANVVRTGSDAEMVRRVGQRISSAVEKSLKGTKYEKRIMGFTWEFILIDDPTINAWCMSGGKVAFYTGILPICKDETGVAVVMGHEIAHAIAQHGNERVSQSLALQGLGTGLQVAMAEKPEQTQIAILNAYGVGAQLGLMLPFSRKHESESDEMGLMYMAMAGYNPSEAPKFWERMNAQAQGQRPPEMLSTHPHPAKRVACLNDQLPEAMAIYNKNN